MSDPYREPAQDLPEAVKELKEIPAGLEAKEQPAMPELSSALPEKPSPVAQEQAPVATGPVSSPPPATPSQPSSSALDADLENDRQLKILVDLAFAQGIDKAVSAARSSENPYLIDKFHDTLVDELRQKLIEGGKLKTE